MSAKRVWQLYFITDARRRYVKIGLSRDAERRLVDLQAGSPLRLRLDLVLSDCTKADEERLHHAFAKHWRHREWFNYAPEIKERVDATNASGEWRWDGIPLRHDRYDSRFGGMLGRYEFMAQLRASVDL